MVDKRAPVASLGVICGMEQLWKAQAWVVDHTTQLLMSAVMTYYH